MGCSIPRRIVSFLLLFVVVAVVVACGGGATTDREASIGFLAGGDEFREFRQRYDQRVSDLKDLCLRRAGFQPEKFTAAPDPPMPTVPAEEMNYYGIVDNLMLMQEYDEVMAQQIPEADPQVSAEERTAYDEVLHGTGQEPGCVQEARTTADVEFRIPEVEAIAPLVAQLTIDSGAADAYQIRVDEWSTCMREQGIDGLVNPSAIHRLVTEQWFRDGADDESSKALDLERSIYLADQECPSPSSDTSLEDAAERILDANPEVEALLSQLTAE